MTKFPTILADPPWAFRNSTVRGAANNHYPTIPDPALRALPVGELAEAGSILFLWAPWSRLDFAIEVLGAWGFEYKAGLPWVKLVEAPALDLDGDLWLRFALGVGWWIRGVSEPVLIGVRPGARPVRPAPWGILGESDIAGLGSLRFKHSRKPLGIHDLAERWPGPRAELFARDPRPGWSTWGNEIERDLDWPGILDWRREWGL